MIRLPYILAQWAISLVLKVAIILPSAVGVLFSVVGDGYKRTPKIWHWCADAEGTPAGWNETRWRVWWFWAVRNPVKVLVLEQPDKYQQWGDIDESQPGLQWRYRRSKWLDSFRIAWGEPKGKKEFYIGWKIGSPSPNKFTIQLRPF